MRGLDMPFASQARHSLLVIIVWQQKHMLCSNWTSFGRAATRSMCKSEGMNTYNLKLILLKNNNYFLNSVTDLFLRKHISSNSHPMSLTSWQSPSIGWSWLCLWTHEVSSLPFYKCPPHCINLLRSWKTLQSRLSAPQIGTWKRRKSQKLDLHWICTSLIQEIYMHVCIMQHLLTRN